MGGLYPKKVVFIYPGIAHIGYGSYEPRLGTGDTDPVYAFSILASLIADRGYSFELIDLRQLNSEEALVKGLKQSDAWKGSGLASCLLPFSLDNPGHRTIVESDMHCNFRSGLTML